MRTDYDLTKLADGLSDGQIEDYQWFMTPEARVFLTLRNIRPHVWRQAGGGFTGREYAGLPRFLHDCLVLPQWNEAGDYSALHLFHLDRQRSWFLPKSIYDGAPYGYYEVLFWAKRGEACYVVSNPLDVLRISTAVGRVCATVARFCIWAVA